MQNDLFHAYIIGGNRELARTHIKKMLEPLNLKNTGNTDLMILECVSFDIDNARDLRSWQELLPSNGEHKVYIVYTDFITSQAENALLKTLEEPIKGTHIFFAVPKPHTLLPTLLSRVRVVVPESDLLDSNLDSSKFIKASLPERLSFIQKLTDKSDDADASAQIREKAVAFLDALEKEISKKINNKENLSTIKNLEMIINFKKYLYTPGASVKMILETIALTI